MSGGRFNYMNDTLTNEIFDYGVSAHYNMGNPRYLKDLKTARRLNPLKDRVISELVFDVFCLLHCFDYAESDDIGDDDYLKDVKYFKKKWLKAPPEEMAKRLVDASIDDLHEQLYRELDIALPDSEKEQDDE